MKKLILSFLLIMFGSAVAPANAQETLNAQFNDLLVSASGDSLRCHVTGETDDGFAYIYQDYEGGPIKEAEIRTIFIRQLIQGYYATEPDGEFIQAQELQDETKIRKHGNIRVGVYGGYSSMFAEYASMDNKKSSRGALLLGAHAHWLFKKSDFLSAGIAVDYKELSFLFDGNDLKNRIIFPAATMAISLGFRSQTKSHIYAELGAGPILFHEKIDRRTPTNATVIGGKFAIGVVFPILEKLDMDLKVSAMLGTAELDGRLQTSGGILSQSGDVSQDLSSINFTLGFTFAGSRKASYR